MKTCQMLVAGLCSNAVKRLTFGFAICTIGIMSANADWPTALDAGSTHAFVLKADGTVWAWGVNTYGQLGDGTTTTRSLPVQVSGLTGVVAMAGEYESSLALRSDGTVWAWGRNQYGQLGDGTTTTRTTPVQVSGLSGVIAISGGTDHSLALKSDGTVWAWGGNYFGQLGDGTTTSRSTPVQVSGLTSVAAIDCGGPNSYALRSDGKVWAWGRNEYGALGDGTTSQRTTPVQVSGLTNAIAISGGGASALALKSDGTVWAWGLNGYGQLGDGTTTSRSIPVQVSGLSGMVALAAAVYHSVALKSDGTVWAWGYNQFGEVGDGTTTQRTTPVQVSGLTGIVSINAPTGEASSHALKSDGTVWGWGHNASYQLGDGTTSNRSTPVQVIWGGPSAPTGVSASDGTYTDRIRVTWNAVSGADGYQLFRNSSDSSNGLSVYATTTSTTYDDTVVTAGATYYYWVKATNAAGAASAFSASDIGYLGSSVAPPNAPTGVSASDGTYTDKVRVTWNTVTNASGYQLFRNSSDSSNGLSVYATTTATTYDDTAVTVGATYYYWVKATNAYGASAFSASDSGYRAAAPGAPSAPTNVVASDGAYTDKVRLSWDTVSDATSYEVWRNTSNDWASAVKIVDTFAFTVLGLAEGVAGLQGAAGGMTYDDTAAVAGTVYYYWVKAKNSSGTSGFSTADSGYVAAAGSLVPPDNVVASDGTYTNKVRIMWSAVDGATAYEVWRGNINVSAFASLLGETAGTLADDTDAIAETTYYYWIKAMNATETSAFSSSDSGFRSNVSSIQPDVKINETDGQITMVRGEDMRVAILLMTSSGIDADWWFIAATPGGWYYYDTGAGTWPAFTDLATLHPSYQGPLFDFLAPVEIISINTSWLIPGVYVIYFGVDTTMDGILNDTLYYDSGTLNLVE